MTKDFFERKIRTLFTRFDIDLNGRLEIDDIKNWGQKLTKSGLFFYKLCIIIYLTCYL